MFNKMKKMTKKMDTHKVVTRNAFGEAVKEAGTPDIQFGTYGITIDGVTMPLGKFQ